MMETICSSETSVFTRPTQHNFPEDDIPHSYQIFHLSSFMSEFHSCYDLSTASKHLVDHIVIEQWSGQNVSPLLRREERISLECGSDLLYEVSTHILVTAKLHIFLTLAQYGGDWSVGSSFREKRAHLPLPGSEPPFLGYPRLSLRYNKWDKYVVLGIALPIRGCGGQYFDRVRGSHIL
jgi:hypothetical protein